MSRDRTGFALAVAAATACGLPATAIAQDESCIEDPGLRLADCNGDRRLDISDPVCLLGFLFRGGPRPVCSSPADPRSECAAGPSFRSADCNGDGSLDISDGVCLLAFLFSGGRAPLCRTPPAAVCGDGVKGQAEFCDDGNTEGGDRCDPTCSLANTTNILTGVPGSPGFTDGPPGMARLGGSGAIAIAGDVLWLADVANNAIRAVQIPTGDVATLAGAAPAGYVDHPAGTSARFSGLGGIAAGGDTIWIGDGGNHRLRAMSAAPPHGVTTAAGSGSTEYSDGISLGAGILDPRGLTVTGGKVYFLEPTAATLRRFDPVNGEVVTLAGTPGQMGGVDGFGAAALFTSPRHMATDGAKLYIADTNGNKIRAYDIATTEVSTLAGNGTCGYLDGPAATALVHRPRGIAFDGKSIFWCEFNSHTVRQLVLATAAVSTLAGRHCDCAVMCTCGPTGCTGSYSEGVGTQAQLNGPFDLAYHPASGALFFLDSGNALLRRIR